MCLILRLFKKIDAGLILAALLTLLIIQNLLQPGLPAAADIPIHLYRTLEYRQAWAPGVIAPRWAPNLAFGYGYPLFVFAPPLPYLLGQVFHGLGLTFEAGLKSLIILTILLYATGMYLFARDVSGSTQAGLVAATAYAFAPFALREALLYGGNVPQFLAIGLFPWSLWAMTRAAGTHSRGWTVLAAIFYAGVLLSHLFHALVFTPVVGAYGILLLSRGERKRTHLHPDERRREPQTREEANSSPPAPLRLCSPALLTIPLGLLLAAFFWIPAFVERFYTRAQAGIYLEKSPFFVRYPHWTELVAWIQPLDARAANPYVPLTLGVVTLILAGLGLLAGVGLSLKRDTAGGGTIPVHLIFFFAVVAAIAIFLALPVSYPVWKTITILQVAEFPWRFLGLANLGLAFLAGAAIILLPQKVKWPVTAICLLVQILAVAPYLYPVVPFVQYGQPTVAGEINYERRSQSIGTTTLGEFLPQAVTRPPTTSPLVETFQAGRIPERLDRSSLPPAATATLLAQNAVTHIYRLDSPVNFTLRLYHFDYPGWQARLDDRPVSIKAEAGTGLMLIDIPAGRHTLTVRFGETPLRVAAMLLSGVTGVGLVGLGIWGKCRRAEGQGCREEKEISSAPLLPCPPTFSLRKLGMILPGSALIIITALWLKPLLRPIFTLHSPPGQALPAQHKLNIDFANGIRLIGYDLSKSVVSPGEYLQVVLYWATGTAPIEANLQPFVHLDRLNDWTTIAGAANYTPGDVTTESNLPTFHWDTARYVRDEHDIIVPPDTAPMAYAVRAGLIDPEQNHLLPLADGSGDTAYLATLNVGPGHEPARPAHRLDTTFSNSRDTIRLTGFEVTKQTPARLDFTLAWRSDRLPQRDYTVFAQLLDRDQNLAAGFDRPPLDGAYPTSTWLPGQTVIDPRHLPLSDVSPGEYQLVVGLYDPVTGERLTAEGGANFVELTNVTIGER